MSRRYFGAEFVEYVKNEEKIASLRAEKIRKKYREIRDRKVAEKLSSIYNMGLNDEDMARQLQFYMYT